MRRENLMAVRARLAALAALCACALAAPQADAGMIKLVRGAYIDSDPSILPDPTGLITFDEIQFGPGDVASGSKGKTIPSKSLDGVFEPLNQLNPSSPSPSGVRFAERFAGQTLGTIPPVGAGMGPFDSISGLPAGPLLLQPGAPMQNLAVMGLDKQLNGVGVLGSSQFDGVGEGSIAILFANDIDYFDLSVLGSDPLGRADFSFFARSGDLLASFRFVSCSAEASPEINSCLTDTGFGFLSSTFDIAGVLIQNADVEGLGIDNIVYREQRAPAAVAAPGTLGLVLLPILLAAGMSRPSVRSAVRSRRLP